MYYIRKQKNKNKTEDNKQVDTKYLLACGRNLINLILLTSFVLSSPKYIATASFRFAQPLNLMECGGKFMIDSADI